ncbi:MAG TPA: PEGA domain-containing protein [Tepidisphaeraceae bacterium]|nr:PEGA domain-containing protein [Tepidisphaeraceae bacterium]
MAAKFAGASIVGLAILLCSAGCVQRTLTIRSNPPGALVYLNDQEIGRTPVTRDFTWYGVYEVEVRKEGYQSIKGSAPVIAPWWQWMPMDFVSQMFPLVDHHDLHFTLRRPTQEQDEPELLVRRAEQLRGQLQGTQRPRTRPTTRPHKPRKPTTQAMP